MNKQEVIELAKKAGYYHAPTVLMAYIDFDLLRYTALVAELEREECAKVCEARYMGDNNREDTEAKACADAIRNRGKE